MYAQISFEASVARFSDISLKQRSFTKSSRQTAARELRPDDIVLRTRKKSISLCAQKKQTTEYLFFLGLYYTRCFIKRTPFSFFHISLKWWSIYTKFLTVVAKEILIQNILTKYGSWLDIFASRDVTLTSYCVTSISLLVSTGAVSCYPVLVVKNLVPSWQILEVLQLPP